MRAKRPHRQDRVAAKPPELVAGRIAEDRAADRESRREPGVERMQPGEDARREDDRAAGNDGADDGERFEKGGGEDDRECRARMRGKQIDQRLQVRFQAPKTLPCRSKARFAEDAGRRHAASVSASRRLRPRVAIARA
jgi:hypothetical protein